MAMASPSSSYEKELAGISHRSSLPIQETILGSDVQFKRDKTLVTVADYGSQALITLVLKKDLPSDYIAIFTWFLRGSPYQYAIALALLDEGRVVFGVLACPNLPLLLVVFSLLGLVLDQLWSQWMAQHLQSDVENPADASFFEPFEAVHTLRDLSSSIAKKLGIQAPAVRTDSQAKYSALAQGDGAIYLRFARKGYRERIWDHAAGYIVVKEAGGVMIDAAGNRLDFSRGRCLDLDTGIIVTNKKLMPSVLNAVQASL